MLWAMQNPDKVEKMIVLNTPLGRQSKLRPELAAYKNRMAFLRPDPKASLTHLPARGSLQKHNCCLTQLPVPSADSSAPLSNAHCIGFVAMMTTAVLA